MGTGKETVMTDQEKEIARLEAAEKDAARYRFLRTPKTGYHKVMFWMKEPAMYVDLNWNELDFAVDEVMKGNQP
jgi:hypothetical protein